MIKEIMENGKNKQLIVTTHNSLIVTSLGLSNLIWLNNNKGKNLSDIPEALFQVLCKVQIWCNLKFLLRAG
jgi:putative ATP-dependent endonuclease of OLD family